MPVIIPARSIVTVVIQPSRLLHYVVLSDWFVNGMTAGAIKG